MFNFLVLFVAKILWTVLNLSASFSQFFLYLSLCSVFVLFHPIPYRNSPIIFCKWFDLMHRQPQQRILIIFRTVWKSKRCQSTKRSVAGLSSRFFYSTKLLTTCPISQDIFTRLTRCFLSTLCIWIIKR